MTCGEAIGDLPSCEYSIGKEQDCYKSQHTSNYQREMRKGAKALYNHVATQHTDHVISVIKQVPEGGNHKDLPKGVGDSRKFNEHGRGITGTNLPKRLIPGMETISIIDGIECPL